MHKVLNILFIFLLILLNGSGVAKAAPASIYIDSQKVSNFDSSGIAYSFYKKYGTVIDAPMEFFNDLRLYLFLEKWIGTRYRFGGTSLSGVDCSSLTGHFAKEVLGATIPRTAKMQHQALSESVMPHELRTGDLVFFHTTRPGISHVGVYLYNNKFLHASSSRGVRIDDLTDKYYANAYRAAKRINATENASSFFSVPQSDIRVMNISGKYRSDILIQKLKLPAPLFHQLNPNFDKEAWTSFMLRLPKSHMESFLQLKEEILTESVKAYLNF